MILQSAAQGADGKGGRLAVSPAVSLAVRAACFTAAGRAWPAWASAAARVP